MQGNIDGVKIKFDGSTRMPGTGYHHGDLREALLTAAVDVAAAEGPERLALRDLARRVGVSHSAAYRHFSSREQLVDAVAARARLQLAAAMLRSVCEVVDPDPRSRARQRLTAGGRAYVQFAITRTGLFRSAGIASGLACVDTAATYVEQNAATDPYLVLTAVLDDLVTVGVLHSAARRDAESVCLSSVHGIAVLAIDGPLARATAAARDRAVEAVLHAVDTALSATTDART